MKEGHGKERHRCAKSQRKNKNIYGVGVGGGGGGGGCRNKRCSKKTALKTYLFNLHCYDNEEDDYHD